VLAECGIDEPPVDAFDVARILEAPVTYDAGQTARGRVKRLSGRPSIFLRPDERPERLQWAVAHELGESLAHRVFLSTGRDVDEAAPRVREAAASEFASRLLLPRDWFLRDARLLDGDVLQLKRHYATASHELILMGLLRLPELTLATVFDHGQLTRRRGNGQLAPPPLLPAERAVCGRVRDTGLPAEITAQGVRVQGWPIHEPGWKRELLRTTAVEEFDAVGEDEYNQQE
jgi:hypothetical protein